MTSPPPLGIPGTWVNTLNANGAALMKWPRTLEGGSNDTTGIVKQDVNGDLVLHTSGQDGNFAGIESPLEYRHGAFECRLHPPVRNGLIANWPAFWLLGDNWPTHGELDAFEGGDGVDDASYWYGPQVGGPVTGPTTGPSFSGDGYSGIHVTPQCPRITAGGWHTVGIVWDKGIASVYNDGRRFVTFMPVRDDPMRIIVNNTEGPAGLQPPGTPSDFVIHYVRQWHRA